MYIKKKNTKMKKSDKTIRFFLVNHSMLVPIQINFIILNVKDYFHYFHGNILLM